MRDWCLQYQFDSPIIFQNHPILPNSPRCMNICCTDHSAQSALSTHALAYHCSITIALVPHQTPGTSAQCHHSSITQIYPVVELLASLLLLYILCWLKRTSQESRPSFSVKCQEGTAPLTWPPWSACSNWLYHILGVSGSMKGGYWRQRLDFGVTVVATATYNFFVTLNI